MTSFDNVPRYLSRWIESSLDIRDQVNYIHNERERMIEYYSHVAGIEPIRYQTTTVKTVEPTPQCRECKAVVEVKRVLCRTCAGGIRTLTKTTTDVGTE